MKELQVSRVLPLSDTARGGLFLLLATFLFSLMQLCVRLLEDLPVIEIVFFRSLIALVVCLWLLRRRKVSPWGRNRRLLIWRGLFGALALYLYFYSIHSLPFATAISIHYLNPIFTVFLAGLLFGEKAHPLQWFFLFSAFAGVLLVKGWEEEVSWWGLAAGLAAGVFAALAYNLIRRLRVSETPLVIVFYFPLVTLPLAVPGTLMSWVSPTWTQWSLLLAIGLLTQAAQMLLTGAFVLAPASKISIFQYSGVLLALIYSYFIFDEAVTLTMGLGALLIASSAAFSSYIGREKLSGPFRGSTQRVE